MRTVLAACLALVLLPAYALADGTYARRITSVGMSGQMVSSPRQEAVLIRDGTTTQVVLRTSFDAGPKELAWVIPVPAAPTDIGPADDKLFTILESSTAPQFLERQASSGGMPFGCGCGAGRGWGHEETPLVAVTVEGQGTAGIYDWTALGAADAAKLQAWLDTNGYRLPAGATPVLDRYVKQGWHWLAVKVRAEETDKPTLAPHPITYRYRSAELVYPLAISQLSAAKESEVVLYVLAADRFNVSNWPTSAETDRWPLTHDPASHSGTNYEKLFREETARTGGHLFVTEFAQLPSSNSILEALPKDPERTVERRFFLTRLRAVMTPQAMDRDVELRSLGSQGFIKNEHYLQSGRSTSAGAPLGLLAMAGFGIASSRTLLSARRRWLRFAGLAALLMAMVAISAV